jgi:hypothetical protein
VDWEAPFPPAAKSPAFLCDVERAPAIIKAELQARTQEEMQQLAAVHGELVADAASLLRLA